MARRPLFAGVLVLCVAMFWLAGLARHRTPSLGTKPLAARPLEKANVVFVVLDACRADRIGATRNGIPVTPTLNRLAKESLCFERAVAPCTWTKPSMASVFTSLYVDTHQVFYSADFGQGDTTTSDALPASIETIASYLKRAGYSSVGIQTNANLTEALGFAQGFDVYLFQNAADADWVTALAIEEVRKRTRPFFLYAHYMEPHAPYDPPERYRALFGPLEPLSPAEQRAVSQSLPYLLDKAYHELGIRDERRFQELSPQGRERLRLLYDAECRFMDDELAKLCAFLESEHENTLLIIVADHGEEFWEHGSMGHGQTMYQEQLAVPFLIQGPGIVPQTRHEPVNTIHILPTVAAYLGLEPKPSWQGQDLLAHLDIQQDSPVFSNTYGSFPRVNVAVEMVMQGDTKLILDGAAGAVELYNLAADPRERRNVAPQRPDTVQEMSRWLAEHRKTNLRHHAATGIPATVHPPPSLLEQLEALGYLDADRPVREQVRLDEEDQRRLKSIGYLE